MVKLHFYFFKKYKNWPGMVVQIPVVLATQGAEA